MALTIGRRRVVAVWVAVLLAALAGGDSVRAAVPANDDVANATVLAAGGTPTADNIEATKEAGEPNHVPHPPRRVAVMRMRSGG